MMYPEVKLPPNSLTFRNCPGIAKLVTQFFNYLLSVVSHRPTPFDIDLIAMLYRPDSKVKNNCEEFGRRSISVNWVQATVRALVIGH